MGKITREQFSEFIPEIIRELESTSSAFIENMDMLGVEEKTLTEWIETWMLWNELGSSEDIKNYWGEKYD